MKCEFVDILSMHHDTATHIKAHCHTHHEFVFCEKGDGFVRINNEKKSFCSGEYYITRKGTVHSETNNKASDIVFFYFDAPIESFVEGAYSDYSGSVFSVIKRLKSEKSQNYPDKSVMLNSLLTQLLIVVKRNGQKVMSGNFYNAIKYIEENFEHKIDVKKLANECGYSHDRFRHIFKEKTGYAPHEYILNQRIEKARILIERNPYASLTEISFSCGFSSSSQFTNDFRRNVGITPTEYKKSLRTL